MSSQKNDGLDVTLKNVPANAEDAEMRHAANKLKAFAALLAYSDEGGGFFAEPD
jgi:hypothetical protein